jgi:hypothetical protein
MLKTLGGFIIVVGVDALVRRSEEGMLTLCRGQSLMHG